LAKRDYYEVLGLEKNATDADIKRAFRQLAKKYHPDVNPGDKDAEAKFKEINEAYEVLSDPQKRSQYDQFGHAGMNGYDFGGFGQGGFGESGFGDIFDMFFGGSPFGGSTKRRNGPERGADLRYDLKITFEEAAFGVKKDINIIRNENCTHCSGSGAKPGTSPEVCPTCHGTGQIQVAQNTAFGRFVNVRTCDTCRGEGNIIKESCPKCSGRGRIRRSRKISVNIPAGIDDDQAITLRGEGEPGKRGGPPGDLYVYISVKPHKLFNRQGYDIHCDIPITFGQAAMGGDIEVPTLEGKVKYTIPEGTSTGTVFRLRGRGVKHLRGSSKGDQYVRVVIDVPKHLNEYQKELLRKFEESLTGKEYQGDKKTFFDKMKDVFNA
jgi:molecular chaperone DnaJ